MARAALEREIVARQLAPIATLGRWLEQAASISTRLPGIAVGAGLGLSALLLVLPRGLPVVRAGLAAFNLVRSVRRLFSRN